MYRILDLFIVLISFPIIIILILMIGILVRINLGSPIFFQQIRPGKDCKPFNLIKFRTMLNTNGDDEERLTKFGKILRSSSLDELPEIFNVLIGDMSIVGPRPLLMEYVDLYDDHQKLRHNIKPGITGWAQINGRNAITWEEKFELDVWYVENRSIRIYLKIILMTFIKVLMRNNINTNENKTMPIFTGTKEEKQKNSRK